MPVDDLKDRYRGLEHLFGLIEGRLTSPLKRGATIAGRAPTASVVTDLIEELTTGFTPNDWGRVAAKLKLETGPAAPPLAIQVGLERAFYRENPRIAAQLENNRHRRLDEAIPTPPHVLETLDLSVAA
ncbi:MAG TPA: hypothetical protein VF272_02415 [Candidatus Saccharimonadia bacterium]